jgi:CheY-like chemotaxis protein
MLSRQSIADGAPRQLSSSTFFSWTGALRRESSVRVRKPSVNDIVEINSTDGNTARYSASSVSQAQAQTHDEMTPLQIREGGGTDSGGGSHTGRNSISPRALTPTTTATEMLATQGHAVLAPSAPTADVAAKELVLVVDDSDLTRKMLCRIMKAQGYDTEEAEDGHIAVEMVRQNMEREDGRTYAVILMDFVMPVMNGPTATRAIRDLGFTAPVLGVTGNGQDFDIAKFVESGANKVFTKPLDVQGFRAYMKAVHDKSDTVHTQG